MTAWAGEGIPAVVIEWKRAGPERCAGDVVWLRVFCDRYPGVIGYSACAMLEGVRGCVFTRVERVTPSRPLRATARAAAGLLAGRASRRD